MMMPPPCFTVVMMLFLCFLSYLVYVPNTPFQIMLKKKTILLRIYNIFANHVFSNQMKAQIVKNIQQKQLNLCMVYSPYLGLILITLLFTHDHKLLLNPNWYQIAQSHAPLSKGTHSKINLICSHLNLVGCYIILKREKKNSDMIYHWLISTSQNPTILLEVHG